MKAPKHITSRVKLIGTSSVLSLLALGGCQTADVTPRSAQPAPVSNAQLPQTAQSASGSITQTTVNGERQLHLEMHFEGGTRRISDFKTQAVNCGDIEKIKVKVMGQGIGEIFPTTGVDQDGFLSNYLAGECSFNASFSNLPEGTLRAVVVEAYNINNQRLSAYSLSAPVDIADGEDTSSEVSFRTSAAARLIKSLLEDQAPHGAAFLSSLTSDALQNFVDRLIFGDVYDAGSHGTFPNYSYATHPALLNYQVLAQFIVDNNGSLTGLPVDTSSYTRLPATLTVTGLDTTFDQFIAVSDPASAAFSDLNPSETSQTIQKVLPGTWRVTVNNGSNFFDNVLSFAPEVTTTVDLGSAPVSPALWALSSVQPETANALSFQADNSGQSQKHILGTTHGVYLSDGAQWQSKGLREEKILSVQSAFDLPRNIFYVGTEGHGIYKTTDSGGKWDKAVSGNGFDNLSVYAMHGRTNFIAPDQLDFLFAATNDGVVEYKADATPNPWSKVNQVLNSATSLAGQTVSDLLEEPGGGTQHLFITVPEGPAAGVYVSQDSSPGNGWYKIDGTNADIAASQPYRLTEDTLGNLIVAGKNGAVFTISMSDVDSAVNTTTPDVSGLAWTVQSQLSVQPTDILADSFSAHAATLKDIYTNANPPGSTWTPLFAFDKPLPNNRVNQIAMEGDLLAFTAGGIARYEGDGQTWEVNDSSGPQTNRGLHGAEISRLWTGDGNTLYIGTRHAGVFRQSSSIIDRLPTLPANAEKDIIDLSQDGVGNLIVLTSSGLYALSNPLGVSGTWEKITDAPGGFKPTHMVINNQLNNSTILVSSAEGSGSNGIYAYSCGGTSDCHDNANTGSWNQVYTQPTYSLFMQGNLGLYAGIQDINALHQVIKSTDGGTSWNALNTVAPLDADSPLDLLYVTSTYALAASSEGGASSVRSLGTLPLDSSWNDISSNLFLNGEQKLTSLHGDSDRFYVGLSQGGVRTIKVSETTPQWFDFSGTQVNQSPGPFPIQALAQLNTPSGELYAGTAGFGIFRTPIN